MKRRLLTPFISFLILILLLSLSHAQTYNVERVVDGDTLLLTNAEYVRLIGVDTPETKHPQKAVEYFGKEAYLFTKKMAEGKEVRLEYDQTRRDRYNRILAYVYLHILSTLSSIWRSLDSMRGRRWRIGYGDSKTKGEE
jgi:endonuclease YncB( thermonuclease family)